MKKTVNILVMLLLVLFLVPSCSADVTDPSSAAEPSSWEEVFLLFWNTMNTEYVHFENEPDLDWDGVYDEYLSKFRDLEFNNSAHSMTAFRYFKEIVLRIRCDNHYNLKIYDGFGSHLDITPSAELKWKGTDETKDLYSYPDVYWIQDGVTSLRCIADEKVIEKDSNKPTIEEKRNLLTYREGVEGYSEVTNLLSRKTTSEGDATYGMFHNSNGVVSDFSQGFVGAAISTDEDKIKSYYIDGNTAETSADVSKMTDTDAAAFWKELVSNYDLEGFTYFYGLSSDGIFYFYLSSFPSEKVLELETILSPITKAETYLALSKEMQVMYSRIWKGENRFYENLKTQISQLQGICSLVNNLRLIGSMNECILADSDICSVKGVVMDVRCNGGGNLNFLFSLMGSFFRKETQIGYLRYKDGYSRYEYTPWVSYDLGVAYCNILADDCYQNPFYIIVNGASSSCSEVAAMMVKLLPGGNVLGTTTYGATGVVSARGVYHSGEFKSKNVNICTSTFEVVGLDRESYEGVGIRPSKEVKCDETAKSDVRYTEAMNAIRKDITAE